ncbi:MAG: hypothetical protein ACM3SQ_00560 [Betaproteobacteria bacterium]
MPDENRPDSTGFGAACRKSGADGAGISAPGWGKFHERRSARSLEDAFRVPLYRAEFKKKGLANGAEGGPFAKPLE